MSEKQPSYKEMDRDGDGITGHEKGLANQGPSWISENLGKLVIGVLVVIIILGIMAAVQDAIATEAAKEATGR
jgi:hypothetical protein